MEENAKFLQSIFLQQPRYFQGFRPASEKMTGLTDIFVFSLSENRRGHTPIVPERRITPSAAQPEASTVRSCTNLLQVSSCDICTVTPLSSHTTHKVHDRPPHTARDPCLWVVSLPYSACCLVIAQKAYDMFRVLGHCQRMAITKSNSWGVSRTVITLWSTAAATNEGGVVGNSGNW